MSRRPPPQECPATPQTALLQPGSRLWRVHTTGYGATAMNAAPSPGLGRGGRFDSADGSYAYTYLGQDRSAAIAETLCRDLEAEQSKRIVPAKAVRGRLLSEVEVRERITVVVLHGAGLTGVGQDTWLTKCAPRDYLFTRQ